MVAGMVMPLRELRAIYELLFRDGVMVAKKDKRPQTKHPEIPSISNLQVIRAMVSLKSRGYVKETFTWRHFYWYLSNEGIVYLRDYLHLPAEIVPASLQRVKRSGATLPVPRRAAHVQSVEGPTSYVPKPGGRPGSESREALAERQGYRHKMAGEEGEEGYNDRTPRFRGRPPAAAEPGRPRASWETKDQHQHLYMKGRGFGNGAAITGEDRVMKSSASSQQNASVSSHKPLITSQQSPVSEISVGNAHVVQAKQRDQPHTSPPVAVSEVVISKASRQYSATETKKEKPKEELIQPREMKNSTPPPKKVKEEKTKDRFKPVAEKTINKPHVTRDPIKAEKRSTIEVAQKPDGFPAKRLAVNVLQQKGDKEITVEPPKSVAETGPLCPHDGVTDTELTVSHRETSKSQTETVTVTRMETVTVHKTATTEQTPESEPRPVEKATAVLSESQQMIDECEVKAPSAVGNAVEDSSRAEPRSSTDAPQAAADLTDGSAAITPERMCSEEIRQATAVLTEAPADKGEAESARLSVKKIKREVPKPKTSSSAREAPAAGELASAEPAVAAEATGAKAQVSPCVAQGNAAGDSRLLSAAAQAGKPSVEENSLSVLPPSVQEAREKDAPEDTPSVSAAPEATEPHLVESCHSPSSETEEANMRRKIVVVEEIIEVKQIANPQAGGPPPPAPVKPEGEDEEEDDLDLDILEEIAIERALLNAAPPPAAAYGASPEDDWDHSLEDPEDKTWPQFREERGGSVLRREGRLDGNLRSRLRGAGPDEMIQTMR
ncbi:hypothetical protein CRUP_028186 [Coryphaenoides rupestris]|nr:hypothetical protein CRUP_028186 [Coryphaenoides rupestris]